MRPVVDIPIPRVPGDQNDWLPDYPNPPDLRFDYYRLLSLAQQNENGIGTAPPSQPSVAVIGGGVAGMTAARELYRCGYKVVIYEASNRICGRHYTVPLSNQVSAMELGAMRFPYFGGPGTGNCLFDYYLTAEANATPMPFPNPGSAPGNTGIFVNQGWGPEGEFYPNPQMIFWPSNANPYNPPNDPYLAPVYKLVYTFISFFSGIVTKLYPLSTWPQIWEQIANNYEKMSFSDLVFTPAISTYNNDGWFGGFGMSDAQSELFYTIGAGDGSWGAFYEIGAMWFIRCVMFGFNSQLQSMLGILNKTNLPYYNDQYLNDSSGQRLVAPLYEGIQSLTEWLFYQAAPGASQSLFQAANDVTSNDVSLFINRPVASIAKTAQGLTVTDINGNAQNFQYAVVTPNLWASQMSIALSGFNITNDLPLEVTTARNEQHNIASCKVFFPLTQTYWNVSKIPQVIISDTFVQDAYGVQWNANDAGALLASYTWEDDAIKLLPYNDADLGNRVLAQLDQITLSTLGVRISTYVNANDATVIHWSDQPTYHGCAKLYRQRTWTQNYSLLAYNQQYSASSGLYFAGENYSVEGGWTEPALRLAIDAVINLIQNSKGSFNNGFNPVNDYPSYDFTFTPDYGYPVCNDT